MNDLNLFLFKVYISKTPIPSVTMLVTVCNCWQHSDLTAIGSSATVLPAVSNGSKSAMLVWMFCKLTQKESV